MPSYTFRCDSCNIQNVHTRSISHRDHLPTCVWCGRPMQRVPDAPNFKLVGSGFHVNDYAKKETK
jgi:putative FmdB family regulatory protein